MTSLDDRLYAWLSEPDDRRFTLAFNSYFLVAFPAVVRHLARFAPADSALLEEIAQDSLLRFFEHIGRGRRAAARAIEAALGQIRPVALGSWHECQVHAWRVDVDSYRRSTMEFRLVPGANAAALTWKNTIRELTLQIPTLQQQGWHLIDAARSALQWRDSDDAETFTRAVMDSAPAATSAEIRLPGTTQLVYGAVTIIHAIPRLQVPTNGYLFEISYTIYLDEYRKQRRQKRGGSSVQSGDEMTCWDEDKLLDDSMDETEAVDVVISSGAPGARITSSSDSTANDPLRRLEDQQYFERFYTYLRAPVEAAEVAYDEARAQGAGTAERRRWASLRKKFSRSVAILAAIGEGYTQEQTAQRLGLTRNQVKYVIETLQDAYARFAAQSGRSSYPRTTGGVPCHGK
jgi:DNA-directed RNA polymerase specialized sigma24 family protein